MYSQILSVVSLSYFLSEAVHWGAGLFYEGGEGCVVRLALVRINAEFVQSLLYLIDMIL